MTKKGRKHIGRHDAPTIKNSAYTLHTCVRSCQILCYFTFHNEKDRTRYENCDTHRWAQVVVVLPVQVRPAVTSEFQPPTDRRSHTERQEGIARCTGNSYLVLPGSCQSEIVLSANTRAHVYWKSSTKQEHTCFHPMVKV